MRIDHFSVVKLLCGVHLEQLSLSSESHEDETTERFWWQDHLVRREDLRLRAGAPQFSSACSLVPFLNSLAQGTNPELDHHHDACLLTSTTPPE